MGIFTSSIVTEILLIIALIILIACVMTGNWKGVIIGGIVLIMLTIIEIPIIS